MEYFMKVLEKAKSFITEPSKAFKKEGKTSFGEAFKYLLVLGIINAVLGGLIAGAILGPLGIVGAIVGIYILMVVGSLVGGLLLHVFACIVGAKKGIEQTFKALFFGQTPVLLLGWIPVIGWVMSIWGIVLSIIGLKELHKISLFKAILAYVLLIVVVMVVILAISAMLFASLVMVGMPGMDMSQMLAVPY